MNIVVVGVGSIGPLIAVVRLFQHWERVDCFLRGLQDQYPQIWVELGRPTGRTWAPKGTLGTPFSMNVQWLEWRDGEEPDWIQRIDPHFVDQLLTLRRSRRSLSLSFGAFLVGGTIVILGLALE